MKVGDVVKINLPPMESYQDEVEKYGICISTEMRALAQAYPIQTIVAPAHARPWTEIRDSQVELDRGGFFYWPVKILEVLDNIEVVDYPAKAKDAIDSVCKAICKETKSRGI